MDDLTGFVRVVHVITAILMAWPAYALVAVNQRARLGAPVGDRADRYMENIIKNRTVPCFVFQGTALLSGLALLPLRGYGFESLASNPALALKLVLLLVIIGLLSYVHLRLQPRIDAAFAQAGGEIVPAPMAQGIGRLRLRRKRSASVCLFTVLTISVLGVQVVIGLSLWLTVALILAAGLFTWRAYSSVTPLGWF